MYLCFPSRYLLQETPGSYSGGWQSQTLKDRFINIIHQKQNRPVLAILGGSKGLGKSPCLTTGNLYHELQPCVKAHMIGYRLGGIVPSVRNDKGVAVRLERITEGNLPRC